MKKAPSSALTPKQAWKGRKARLVLLGRKHVNGEPFTETYPIHIEDLKDTTTLAELIAGSLATVRRASDIPADLIEGVEFRFVSPTSHSHA